jgi:hypothetical protein
MEIIAQAELWAEEGAYVFPGRSGNKPLSNVVSRMALRRINLDATAHGFRSSFRDWAAKPTIFPREACEGTLAHTVENKVEAANGGRTYLRRDGN